MAETIVSILTGGVGLILLLSIVYSAGFPSWIAIILAGFVGMAQAAPYYEFEGETRLAVAVGAMGTCAVAACVIFRSATAFRLAACGCAAITAFASIALSFERPPLEWRDDDLISFGSHGAFTVMEASSLELLQSVSMTFAICGFALGSFRRHSFAWSRHLYRVCVSLVLLYLLGLILNWRLGENGAPALYKRLFWPSISIACFGILLQVSTGVQTRIARSARRVTLPTSDHCGDIAGATR